MINVYKNLDFKFYNEFFELINLEATFQLYAELLYGYTNTVLFIKIIRIYFKKLFHCNLIFNIFQWLSFQNSIYTSTRNQLK